MKKALILLSFVMAVLLILPVIANAESATETKINEFVQSMEKIRDAKCVVYENKCVIAIRTEKFVTKSDYAQFKDQLKQEITDKFNMNCVIVTRNPKVMHGIEQLYNLSEGEREEAIQKIVTELEKKDHPQIQPR